MRPMPQPPSHHDFGPSAQDEADLREHASFAATQDPIALEAASWFSRRGQLDAASLAEFAGWQAADASHARAYAAMENSYQQARQIPPEIAARWKVAPAAAVAAVATPPRRHWLRSWPYASAAMLVLGVALPTYQWWQQQPLFSAAYASARGQRLAVSLPDGSALQLDTATELKVTLYRQRREVQLLQGAAMFQVQNRQGQPFEVLTGPLRVTVVGTQFAVRNTLKHDGSLSVAVQHGHVKVAGLARQQIDLLAGQGVTADAAGQLSAVSSLAPGSVAPWREGRVTFENVPLSAALAEFERYGDTGFVVRDPRVASLRLGGSFSLDQPARFVHALPQLLPVQISHNGAVGEIRMAPRTAPQAPALLHLPVTEK